AHGELPIVLGSFGVGLSIFLDYFVDGINDRIRILVWGNHDFEFIPQPLPAGGEIEEVAFDGVAIHEGNFTSGGMTGVGPVAGFEQHGSQQIYFHYFTDHAVDLNPIANANSVASHQHEPTDEGHDEIFQSDSQSCAGQAEDGRHLIRDSE